MLELATRYPEIPSSNHDLDKNDKDSLGKSEQEHNQTLCIRVEYLKFLEVNNINQMWHNGRVQD